MEPSWNSTEAGVQYGTVTDLGTGLMLRLVVEKLPDAEFWDWVVWRNEGTNIQPHHGKEKSLLAAIIAAENAANNWMAGTRDQPC